VAQFSCTRPLPFRRCPSRLPYGPAQIRTRSKWNDQLGNGIRKVLRDKRCRIDLGAIVE
jgi:hypothetical protein